MSHTTLDQSSIDGGKTDDILNNAAFDQPSNLAEETTCSISSPCVSTVDTKMVPPSHQSLNGGKAVSEDIESSLDVKQEVARHFGHTNPAKSHTSAGHEHLGVRNSSSDKV